MHRRLALVRRPSPRLADGIVTHIARSGSVDAGLALRQWEEYVAVLRRAGWRTVEAPPVDGCPDGVFVEDQVVVHGDMAVLCRSGAPGGARSSPGCARCSGRSATGSSRCRAGTLDGGDVLKHGRDVWVGLGGRSDTAGVEQLAEALAGRRGTVSASR